MEAIRKFVKVKNKKISITLPDNFTAEEVEVIILPKLDLYEIPKLQIEEVRERTKDYNKNPEIALNFDDVIKEIEDGLQSQNSSFS